MIEPTFDVLHGLYRLCDQLAAIRPIEVAHPLDDAGDACELLARDLEELVAATSAGLAALDLEVDGCDR